MSVLTDIYTPEFFAEHRWTVLSSAGVVVPLVKHLLDPQSLLDVGCGEGDWMEAFDIEDSVGVDIAAPERESFHRFDLTKPFGLNRMFDLVISLETAEHLPEEAANIYVESIAYHADKAVLFSAAVVGQEGLNHINCQPHEYWHEKFASYGLEMTDPIRPMIAEDQRVSWWYRNNLFVYVR